MDMYRRELEQLFSSASYASSKSPHQPGGGSSKDGAEEAAEGEAEGETEAGASRGEPSRCGEWVDGVLRAERRLAEGRAYEGESALHTSSVAPHALGTASLAQPPEDVRYAEADGGGHDSWQAAIDLGGVHAGGGTDEVDRRPVGLPAGTSSWLIEPTPAVLARAGGAGHGADASPAPIEHGWV